MWKTEETDDYKRQFRWYEKKKKRELAAVIVNLQTYFTALEVGASPLQITHRFVHPEPHGVVAIGQDGRGANLAVTRLYTYPFTISETLFLLTIGGKDTQQADIKQCSYYVAEIQGAYNSDDQIQREGESLGGEKEAL